MDIKSMTPKDLEEMLDTDYDKALDAIREHNIKIAKVADPRAIRRRAREAYLSLNYAESARYIMDCVLPAVEAMMSGGIEPERDKAISIVLDTLRILIRYSIAVLKYKEMHPDEKETEDDTDIQLLYKEMFGITRAEEMGA